MGLARGLSFRRQVAEYTGVSGDHQIAQDGQLTNCQFTLSALDGPIDPIVLGELQRLHLNSLHGIDIMPSITHLVETHPDLQLIYQTDSGLTFEHDALKAHVLQQRDALTNHSESHPVKDKSGAISWYEAFSPATLAEINQRFGNQMVMLALDGSNFGLLNDSGLSDFIDHQVLRDLRAGLRDNIHAEWLALGLPAEAFDFEFFRKGGDEFFIIIKSNSDTRSIEAALAGLKKLNDQIADQLSSTCTPETLDKILRFTKIKQAAGEIIRELSLEDKQLDNLDRILAWTLFDRAEATLPLHEKLIFLAQQRARSIEFPRIPGTFDAGVIYSGNDTPTVGTQLNAFGLISMLALCDAQQYNSKKAHSNLPIDLQAQQIYEFSKQKVGWHAQRSADLIEVSTLVAHQKLVQEELNQSPTSSLDTQYLGLTLAKRRTLAERGTDSLVDIERASDLTLAELLGPFTTPREVTLIFDEPANFGAFNKVLKDAARANLIVEERAHSVIKAACDAPIIPILLLKHGAAGIIRVVPKIDQDEEQIKDRIRACANKQDGIHTNQTFGDSALRAELALEIVLRNGLTKLKTDLGLTSPSAVKSDKLVVKHTQISHSTTLADLQALVS